MKELHCKQKIKKEINKYNEQNKKGRGGFYFTMFYNNVCLLCEKYFKNRFESLQVEFYSCGYVLYIDVYINNKKIRIKG